MKLSEVYRLFQQEGEGADRARVLLQQRHWFTTLAEFDPRTGDALPLGFDTVVRRLRTTDESGMVKDRLWRITEHSRGSIRRIFASLNENPRRDHAWLPLRAVRELSASSFISLSRRPGRNVREKLADKPYMHAVRRFQSIDLPQNQLLKEFVIRLVDLLELRSEFLGQRDDLIADIHRWLRSDEALAISGWRNLPANNTLLSHRDYRRIWDAWRWIQSLDDDTASDFELIDVRAATIAEWEDLAERFANGKVLFGNIPVLFDYESFGVDPWCPPVSAPAPSILKRDKLPMTFSEPACVDLTRSKPLCGTASSKPTILEQTFVWQSWQNDDTTVSIEAFDSDLVMTHPGARSITLPDLFFGSAEDSRLQDKAATAFSRRLKRFLASSELVWLVPDCLNDFVLATLRRNLNAQFADAEPLPRSVAAVIENVEYSKIKGDGYEVVVFDFADGSTFATKLVARYDADLHQRVPETHGFFWERTPHVVLETDGERRVTLDGVPRMDPDGRVTPARSIEESRHLNQVALRHNTRLGGFDAQITLTKSPIRGGTRFHELQKRAGDIPIWRDNMPKLSIKTIEDGMWQALYLVEARPPVRPIRGTSIPIPVDRSFTLAEGQNKYTFPLYQGDSADDLGFMAELTSPAFPLDTSTKCKLELTYTYGADDPYCLKFVPVDRQFPPVQATWRPVANDDPIDLSQLPVPPFPAKKSWASLQRWPRPTANPKTGATENDLLEWIQSALEPLSFGDRAGGSSSADDARMEQEITRIKQQRVKGVHKFGNYNDKGQYFCFVVCDGEDVYCNQSQFVEPVNEYKLAPGDDVYLLVNKAGDGQHGVLVSYTQQDPPQLEAQIRKFLAKRQKQHRFDPDRAAKLIFNASFPSHTVWRDGRTISESDCPGAFRSAIRAGLARCEALYLNPASPQNLKDEIYKFACRLHVDTPELFQGLLIEAVDSGRINYIEEQGISCAIGTCSEDWQQYLLHQVLVSDLPNKDFILSVALWKSVEPVRFLGHEHVDYLLYDLESRLSAEIDAFSGEKSVRRIGRMFEILLAVLRTRESSDRELKALLAPTSRYGRSFTNLVDSAIVEVVKFGGDLHSRVELSIDKPNEFRRIPDLLFALRLYLTGDDGASAIRITSISDGVDQF